MKNLILIFFSSCICIFCNAQNTNKDLIGKWQSIDKKQNIVLLFTSDIERKYVLKKGIKKVPIYNIEQARISVNGNLLNEKEPGGGGIDMTYKFEISNDILIIYYESNAIKCSFKKINDKTFQLLTGRKF